MVSPEKHPSGGAGRGGRGGASGGDGGRRGGNNTRVQRSPSPAGSFYNRGNGESEQTPIYTVSVPSNLLGTVYVLKSTVKKPYQIPAN